jgi:hypothetical protein
MAKRSDALKQRQAVRDREKLVRELGVDGVLREFGIEHVP